MREIKFRGVTHEFSSPSWVYGDLICNSTDAPRIMDDYHDCYEPTTWLVDPETVGQFTGLHDANGREIYERDVIKLGNEVYTVSWAKYSACWFVDLKNFGPSLFTQYHAGKSIVIGNVHDNPELLR